MPAVAVRVKKSIRLSIFLLYILQIHKNAVTLHPLQRAL